MKTQIDTIKTEIAEKKKLISKTRLEIKLLTDALYVAISKHKEQQALNELKECASSFDGNWAELVRSGLTVKQVVSLQNLNAKYKELGEVLGVCSSRAREIQVNAIRRISHPARHKLAKRLGLYKSLGIDKLVAEQKEREERRKNMRFFSEDDFKKQEQDRLHQRALIEKEFAGFSPVSHSLLFPKPYANA